MWGYDIEFAGETGEKNRIYIVRRPGIPAPVHNFTEITIPGRDGNLYMDEGTNGDIQISVEFNFMGEPEEWFSLFRRAKRWLLQPGQHTLKFLDDRDYFFKAKKVEIATAERPCYEIGRFTAVFFCAGYHYAVEGMREVDLITAEECLETAEGEVLQTESGENIALNINKGTVWNDYDISMPVYIITGEGFCELKINGRSMTANVSGTAIIDTERRVAYRADGTNINTDISGWYEEMYLMPGENSVEIIGGMEGRMIPNWRVR